MRVFRFTRIIPSCFIACVVVATGHGHAMAGIMEFHDWTSTFTGGGYTFNNTSSAGTISGSSALHGFGSQPGTFGVPYAITPAPGNLFTSEFQISGTNGLGASVDFNFSSGYAWGTGGQLILGNIHNYFEYTLSAWNSNNQPIDVNAWTLLSEYPSTAPGTLGYFSTSQTMRSASGDSSNFFVVDPMADGNGGQGGVLLLGPRRDRKCWENPTDANGQQSWPECAAGGFPSLQRWNARQCPGTQLSSSAWCRTHQLSGLCIA